MKKGMFMVAAAALSLASCSNDEVVSVQQDVIEFAAVTDNASRGTVLGNPLQEFKVFSVYNGTEVFMNDVKVYNNGTKYVYDEVKFWPVENALDFYAYAPLTLDKKNVNFTKESRTISYEVPTAVNDQLDLLYSVNTGLTKADGVVNMNFRHALAQIEFQAANKLPGMKVEIAGVRVVNALNSGMLTLPAGDTDENSDVKGTWALGTTYKSYPAEAVAVTLDGETAATAISAAANPLLLMPQTVAPAKVDENGNMSFAGEDGKALMFFAIKCRITSVEKDKETGAVLGNTVLWPKNAAQGYAEVVIPATAPDGAWQQGVKYVYTFVFGTEDGTGGYVGPNGPDAGDPTDPTAPVLPGDPTTPADPSDPTNPNEPGEPVLVKVGFTVKVDDFHVANMGDVNM